MKKFLLSSLLGVFLLWFGGISVATVSDPYWSITYTLNGDNETQYEAKFITIDTWGTIITILDRNLWATSNNINSSDSHWFHFQWWNNYWFSTTTTPASSTTQASASSITTLPYSSNKFIYWEYIRNWLDDNDKVDLWWWTTGDWNIYSELTEGQAELRQWPCPEWFHVPTAWELSKMIELMWANKSEMRSKLKIPYVGYRNDHYNTLANDGTTAYWWSSSPVENSSSSRAFYMWYESDDRDPDMTPGSDRADGYSVRCFYNEYAVYPIQKINNITISWITDPVLWQYSTTQWITVTPDNGEIGLVSGYLTWKRIDWDNNESSATDTKFSDEYEKYRLQIVYNPAEWYEMADDYTVTVENSNYGTITTWYTNQSYVSWYYVRIDYPVSQMPQGIDHILLIWDLGRFVHWTTPPTDITTNTTWINLWAVTWWKGSSCAPLEANETFVSSSNYEDYYCLTIPFTVDEWYVLRNNYYIYRKNIESDRSTDRVYASDYEYACTASEIKIKYLYPEHTINFVVDWQPRNDTRYRRNWCTLYECGSYGAYPQQPTKEWYVFEWWYTEDTFDNKWNWYSSGITENITLYANWLNKINTITISGITVPTSWAQATLEWIEKSADPTAWINRWTLVWKVPTNDNSEDPQPVDFNGIFQWWKSYRLYVPFTIAEWYWIQKWYSNTTIFTVNWTQKDINYDIWCSNSSCSAWLSYYVPYIITFYDGETVYTTWTAYAGDTIDYTWSITNPYVSWKKFLWWFKDPELTQQRRLDTDTVTWDMNLYGKFANQLMNINLTWVVAPEGNVTATVAWISLAEWTSGVQLWTLKWKEWESDFNWKYVSWTQYTLYVPFKLIDDYVMPDYYSYISFSVNGEYIYKEIWSTGNEDYPYYIRTYFTATAPSSSSTTPSWGSNWWWGGGGWWGGWSSYSCKNLPANATANNKTTPKSNTDYTYDTDTTKVCTFQCNSGYTWNTTSSKCEKAIEATTWDTVVADNPSGDNNWDTNNPQEILANGYTREFNDAYEFAYKNEITTMDTIDKADMNWPLTRIAMAKMLSQYAINVLGKKPANIVVPNFPDITPELDEQYNYGVTLAYQLWIMGINIEEFRPNDLVTRAEFATALSRMLFSTPDGDPYYITHLAKLKAEKIITNDDPSMRELRWYVMIMLMRSAKN